MSTDDGKLSVKKMREMLREIDYKGRSKLRTKQALSHVVKNLQPDTDHVDPQKQQGVCLPMKSQDIQNKMHCFLSGNALRSYTLVSKRTHQATRRNIQKTDRFYDLVELINRFLIEDKDTYYHYGMEMKNSCDIRISNPQNPADNIDISLTIDDKDQDYDPRTYDKDEDTVYTLTLYYTDHGREKKRMWTFPRKMESRVKLVQKIIDLIRSNPLLSQYRWPRYKKISNSSKQLIQHLKL